MRSTDRPNEPLSLMKAGMTRRQVIHSLGLLIAGGVATSLLAACDDTDDDVADAAQEPATDDGVEDDEADEPGEPEVADDPEEEAAEGRNLVVAVQQLPGVLDPVYETNNVGTRTTYTIFDYLLERDFKSGDIPGAGSELRPMLAESWERVDDLTIEFVLREDVTFHNGDALTAEDVKFSFDRLIVDPPDELLSAVANVITIDEANVVDEHTVQFVTREPDPLFMTRFATWSSWILPKDYFEEVGEDEFSVSPVGTGPYKVVSFSPDSELILEAFEDYFMGPPAAPEVELRVIPEVAGRISALISGEVDISTNIPPDQVQTVDAADGTHVKSIQLSNRHVINYNTFHPDLSDSRMRRALNLAIDRELIIETIWGGLAVLTRSIQMPEYADYLYDADRPYMEYDPDRARELLDEVGYDGAEIVYGCANNYYTNEVAVGEAIVQMWKDIGINASQLVNDRSINDERSSDETYTRVSSNSSINADPDGSFWRTWGPESAVRRGYTGWDHGFWEPGERFDELAELMRTTIDEDERAAQWREVLDIWEEDQPGTVLYIPMESYGIRDDVDWQPYSFYYLDLRPHNLRFV